MLGIFLMAMTTLPGAGDGQEPMPTGALPGWTSAAPIVVEARDLVAAGRWADAEKLLATGVANDKEPAVAQACATMAEIIRRLRQEYDVDEERMLAKIHKSLPDVTAEDLKRWRDAGQVRFRMVDGRVRYFRREPGVLFRVNPEVKQRLSARDPDALPAAGDARMNVHRRKHLEEIIAAADKTGQVEVLPIKHRVTFKLTVEPNRPGAKVGSVVRCWLPYPQEYRQQKDVKLIRTVPAEHTIAPNGMGDGSGRESRSGSPNTAFPGAAQRTLYLEQALEDPARPTIFEAEFEYTSCAYYPKLDDAAARPLPADFDRRYLAERPPHIVFTPEIKTLAAELAGDETNPLIKARRIFHYLDRTVPWAPEEEYSVIPSFCLHALNRKQGDCGVQSTLFITLCRAAGVPARWQSGLQTQPWSTNLHDWSEIYIEPWGWLPVDVSYGLQASDDPKVREFFLGHQDSYRLIVNLDYGCPFVPAKNSPRSEPADCQRGEVEIDGRNLFYDEWDSDFRIEWEPLKQQ